MGVSRQNGTHLFIFAYGRARALPGTAHLRKVEFDNVGEGLANPVIATCTNFIGRSRAPPLLIIVNEICTRFTGEATPGFTRAHLTIHYQVLIAGGAIYGCVCLASLCRSKKSVCVYAK
mgnify:CR=1 FL=1